MWLKMNFKLLETVLETRYSFSCLAGSLRKTPRQLSLAGLRKKQFCTNKDDKESQLKKMLNESSPLRPTEDAEKFWATSPYVSGTVFNTLDEDETPAPLPPGDASIIMFPGQGNQFVGMTRNLKQYPLVKEMFDAASEILHYDLFKLCENGPEEKLNNTEYSQLAILVCSLGALEKLKEEKPWAINNCVGTCGYSLGEFSSLVFAGCLSFERAVKLVQLRAKAMALCCQANAGGMMTVLYGASNLLSEGIRDAIEHCNSLNIENPHCSVASYLFPGCRVVAGNVEALNFLYENSRKYKLKKLSKLPVSGAFHTPMMKCASEAFQEAIKNVEIMDPLIRVYSNVDGKRYQSAQMIKKMLPKQIYLPVKWEQTMHYVFTRPKEVPYPIAYECGPGNSLTTVLRKLYPKSVEVYGVQL